MINFLGILCKELFRPYFWKILLRKKQNIDQGGGVSKNYIFIIKTIIHHKSLDCTDVALLSKKGKYYSVFIPAYCLKRLSPIISPTGEEALIPIQVYSCGNCGKVPDKLKQSVED